MIKLLIVDDSPLMRRLLLGIFAEQDDFETEIARDGLEAIEKLHAYKPDVITLDIHMPGLDGMACLDRIMLERPSPVVMVSALTEQGAAETLEAMALGAVDFVPKPSGPVSLEIDRVAPLLIEKVRLAASAKLSTTARLAERVRLRTGRSSPTKNVLNPLAALPLTQILQGEQRLVLVGSSTGGPPALEALLTALPRDFPWPILIAQHMPASFTGALARRLDRLSALDVEEVSRPTLLLPGHAYIGRGDADLTVSRQKGRLFALAAPESSDHRWHPSVDRMVDSAMKIVGAERLIGVLMTGMGDDGAKSLTNVFNGGGTTIAEAEDSAIVWGMPGALVRMGGASRIVPLSRIAAELMSLVPVG